MALIINNRSVAKNIATQPHFNIAIDWCSAGTADHKIAILCVIFGNKIIIQHASIITNCSNGD